jgi:hypothetical protein
VVISKDLAVGIKSKSVVCFQSFNASCLDSNPQATGVTHKPLFFKQAHGAGKVIGGGDQQDVAWP